MSFDKVFQDAWNEYKNNIGSICIFLLLFYILPLVVVSLICLIAGVSFALASGILSNPLAVTSLSIGSVFGIMVMTLVLVAAMAFVYSGFYGLSLNSKKYTWKTLANSGKKSFWKFLGRMILLILLLILLFILLIIPGIIFSIYWIFAAFIWFNEPGKGFKYSLKKSKALVKGRWWKTFGYVLLVSILVAIVNAIISLVPVIGAIVSIVVGFFTFYFFRHLYIDYSRNKR